MKKLSRLLPLVFSSLWLASCANPYRSNFNSTWDRYPAWVGPRLAPPSDKPQLKLSDDARADGWTLFERGYIMIGYSKFDGPKFDTDLAVAQAKSVKADIVLLERKYAKTLTETATLTTWPADETTEVRENTKVSGGERGSRNVERRVEVTTSRGPETVYVPKQVDYFEYAATFWRKVERPIFGAQLQDLSDDLRQKLQTNRGLMVRAIATDSPAFNADLLKGDVILKINGNPVPSAAQFYENLATLAGTTIEISILRGSAALQRKIQLNP